MSDNILLALIGCGSIIAVFVGILGVMVLAGWEKR